MISHNRFSRLWRYYILFGAMLLALSACAMPAVPPAPGVGTLSANEQQTAEAQSSAVAATVSALQTMEAATAGAGASGSAPPATVTPDESGEPADSPSPTPDYAATELANALQTPTATQEVLPTFTPTAAPTEMPPLEGAVDFNADGYPDLVVGNPGQEQNDQQNAGAIYCMNGGPQGLNGDSVTLMIPHDFLPPLGNTFSDDIGTTMAAGDFDGDGFTDLAFTWYYSPRHDESGSVVVLHGASGCISYQGWELWDQDDHWEDGQVVGDGLLGSAESADRFGFALATGDFNGDSYDDLAIGVPYEDHSSGQHQGSVNVLYGSPDGLTHVGNQIFSQASFLVEENGGFANIGDLQGQAQSDDLFGYSLASGDINDDGFADLVVGVPDDNLLGHVLNAGSAHIVFGTESGLSPAGNIRLDQGGVYIDSNGNGDENIIIEHDFLGTIEENDAFGFSVTVGNFNGDRYDDIAIGVPYEDLESGSFVQNAGAVNLYFGWFTGIYNLEYQFWTQDSGVNLDGPIPGSLYGGPAEENDRFGFAMTAADFNGDGYDDLAVGAPYEELSGIYSAGTVSVLYGSPAALTSSGSQSFNQVAIAFDGAQTGSLASDPFQGEKTGFTLTAGDYNRDGYWDLVIGSFDEQVGSISSAGGIFVLYGKPGIGLTGIDQQRWTENGRMDANNVTHEDIPGEPQAGDKFGGGLR